MAGFLCPHVYHPCSSAVLCDEECDQRRLFQIPFERHRLSGIAQDILYYQQVISLHIVRFFENYSRCKKKKKIQTCPKILHNHSSLSFCLTNVIVHLSSSQHFTLFFAPVITDCEIFAPVDDFFFLLLKYSMVF